MGGGLKKEQQKINDMIKIMKPVVWCEKNKIKNKDIAIKNFIKIFFL
ncbi:MAG TPA: hypothetical protein PK253_10345 [Spirochaetota bacterium]|nr:hypothetical protein [Spirochaetota bacterium]